MTANCATATLSQSPAKHPLGLRREGVSLTIPPTIMLIDDDSHFLDLLALLLGEDGYAVQGVTRDQRPADQIRARRPALVISDLRAQAGGWELLERLRRDPATRPIPVLVCTGDVMAVRRRAAALDALR